MLVLPAQSPGIVVGIEGVWGSGKSTVIGYIVKALSGSAKHGPIVIHFNPWMLAGADALVAALLTELAAGIGLDKFGKQAKKKLQATKTISAPNRALLVRTPLHARQVRHPRSTPLEGHSAHARYLSREGEED